VFSELTMLDCSGSRTGGTNLRKNIACQGFIQDLVVKEEIERLTIAASELP